MLQFAALFISVGRSEIKLHKETSTPLVRTRELNFILLSLCIFTYYSVNQKMHKHKLLYSVGEHIDTNKNYKVVYVCAFVGFVN